VPFFTKNLTFRETNLPAAQVFPILLKARATLSVICVLIPQAPIAAPCDQEDKHVNKRQWSAVSGLAVGALVVTGLTAPMQAQATPVAKAPVSGDPAAASASRPDNLPNPLAEAQAAETKDAVAKLLKGEATTKTINGNRVIEVKSKGTYKNGKPKKSKYVNYPVNRGRTSSRSSPTSATRRCPPRVALPARCTTTSRSPTASGTATRPTTTRRTGPRTSTASTTST